MAEEKKPYTPGDKADFTVLSENFSPEILRNQGVPIKVRVVNKFTDAQGNETWKHEPNSTEEKIVALTTWHLHLLEERYGTLSAFTNTLAQKQVTTCVVVLSMLFGWEPRKIAEAMMPNYTLHYAQAIYTAYEIAMGSDPKDGWEVTMAMIDPKMKEMLANRSSEKTDESSGPSSGESGSKSAENQTNSGPSPLVSSLES